MSSLSSKALVLAFFSVALASQACTLASPTEVQMVPAKQGSDATEGSKSEAQTAGGKTDGKSCDAKLAKVDVSKLTACGDKGGHCYPKSKVPGGGAGALPCEKADEVCVADVILEAGGDKLTACHVQAMGGAEGVCIPLGPIAEGPEKELAKTNLKQDVCAEGLVCSPCVDIRTNTSTGLCGPVGVSEGSCGGSSDSATTGSTTAKATATAPTCCGGKGTCMPNTISDKMSKDTCTGDLVCAPMALTQGKATKCDSRLGAGICLDACFNDMLALGGMIFGQDKCDDSESCIPCRIVSTMAPDGVQVPGCEAN